MPPVIVIGAGIVGVCAAAWLQRAGRQVLLIDQGDPGMGASFGNGGIFSASSIVPVAMPGVIGKVPGWLLDAEGPLTIRWSYLPRLAPWLARFVAASTPERVEAQARALRALLEGSLANYAPLVKDAGAEDLVRHQGMLYLYASEASWRGDARAMELRRRNGVAIEEITGAGPRRARTGPGTGLHACAVDSRQRPHHQSAAPGAKARAKRDRARRPNRAGTRARLRAQWRRRIVGKNKYDGASCQRGGARRRRLVEIARDRTRRPRAARHGARLPHCREESGKDGAHALAVRRRQFRPDSDGDWSAAGRHY
jgi:glycine/D-amino acid oxidase-like deaminating enzyme